MDRVLVAENRAVARHGAGIDHGVVDVLHARPLAWQLGLGYLFMAAPVMATFAGHEIASPEAAMAWCGYVLMSASVLGTSFGLAYTPAAALGAYALLLLGFAIVSIAMLPLRPMERFLREENRTVRNGNRQGDDEVVVLRAMGMDWTGYYFLVTATVLVSWAGLVEGPASTFFAFALLLLGVTFIIIAMLALAKPKMA